LIYFTWPRKFSRKPLLYYCALYLRLNVSFTSFFSIRAYNLGVLLREDPSSRGLLYLTGCFLPIIHLWSYHISFVSRFQIPQNDVYHRLLDVACLMPLATAVGHIRPVPILSDPMRYRDMFIFCLSLTIASLLYICRLVEIMVCATRKTPGLYQEAWYMARKLIAMAILPTLFFLAAATYSAMQYSGSHSADLYSGSTNSSALDSNHTNTTAYNETRNERFLADSSYPSGSVYDDTAIWLLIGESLAWVVSTYAGFISGRLVNRSAPEGAWKKYV
jgi:hypothetical protein